MVTAGAKREKTRGHTFAPDWLILGGETSKSEGADPTIPEPNLHLHNLKSVPEFNTWRLLNSNINKYIIASTLEFLQSE